MGKYVFLICLGLALNNSLAAQALLNGFYYVDVPSDSTLNRTNTAGTWWLRPTPAVKGRHITSAKVKQVFGQWVLEISLNEAGRKALFMATKAWEGKQMAIVVGDGVVSAPFVQEAISGGRVQISGAYTKSELGAMRRALLLRQKRD